MSEFDVDLTVPLDDNILKDFNTSYQSPAHMSTTQSMAHMSQQSQQLNNMQNQVNRGQQMSRAQQIQINQIKQQLQSGNVMQSSSPSPAVSSPSPNQINSPQPQLQKIVTNQQNVRIAPQQISYQQQQPQVTLVSNNQQKNYLNQQMTYQQQQQFQQQQQQKIQQQQQQINNSTSATRLNTTYQTNQIQNQTGVSQSNSNTNTLSQPAILVKNSNGQYQVLTTSVQQANKPATVQQSNSAVNIQQQQLNINRTQQINQQQQQQQQSQTNPTILRFPSQGNLQQPSQQQVISAQQLNQQGQNLVVITTNGGLTALSSNTTTNSNLIASLKTQPQQAQVQQQQQQQQSNQQQSQQNFIYQNKSQNNSFNPSTPNDRASLTPTPNSMINQQQQQRNVQPAQGQQQQQPQQNNVTQQQSTTPTALDLLKCLRKFLHTLLDLAKNSLPEKHQLVQNLIQELLDERIDSETFIKKIQIEKNPPSPSLVPFLTKAINQWKQIRGNQSIPITKFFDMIPPPTSSTPSATATTQSTTITAQQQQQIQQQQPQQQQITNGPIVIATTSNTATTTNPQVNTTNTGGIPILASLSQGSIIPQNQNVVILNRTTSTPIQQQQQQQSIQPQIQSQIQQQQLRTNAQQIQQQQQNIVTIQNGTTMSQQQMQLKYQQQQQQQQQNQQQQQQKIVQQQQIIQSKTGSPQIQVISAAPHGQFTLQPQFQTQSGAKLTIQQQQLSQSPHANIALAKVASTTQFQAQTNQQIAQLQQSNVQSPSQSVKILNTSISNLNQISSPLNQASVLSPMTAISSPIKVEPHHLMTQTPQSPAKIVSKVIKMEDTQTKIKTEEYKSDEESMFGVDLEAEKKSLMGAASVSKGSNLDQIRACKEEKFLNIMILHKKFVEIAKKYKLDDVSVDVATLVSHATQEYLRGILEKLNVVSQHRLDMSMRTNEAYEMTNDVKSQIKFMEELDKIEKKRKDEADRERLMKAAKSRSKGEDGGELSKLKQKAKEVIQAESDELRRQDANKTALAAIGPRKKRKIEETGTGAGSGGAQTAAGARAVFRPKIKRVSLRDLIFVLEQEKEFRRSTILYKALNK